MKASIIIPAYNTARYIQATLDSVLAQVDDDIEVIVVDDGSTDDTVAKVRGYGSRVRLFEQPNSGPADARNKAVGFSRGEIIFFFDSDDLMLPDKIGPALQVLARHPELGMVFTDFTAIDAQGGALKSSFLADYSSIRELKREPRDYYVLPKQKAHIDLVEANYIGTPGVAMPRRVFQELGGFTPHYYCGEDWDLWMRVTEKYDIAFLPAPSFAYRLHGANSSWTDPVRNYTSQIAGLTEHMQRSTNPEFRHHAAAKIAACHFSLGCFYYRNGQMAEARSMLRRSASKVAWSKIAPVWLKTWLGASISRWLRSATGRAA